MPASAILFLTGCGVTECDSGNINISTEKPEFSLLFNVSDKGDLPSHFEFSSAEFAEAIVGTWTDSEQAVTLILTPSDPAEVQYSISEDSSICVTESSIEVTGEMDDSVESDTLAGIFSSSESVEGANLNLGDETKTCWFEYKTHDDGTIMLHGSCLTQDPDGGEATSEELAFVKN